MPPVTNHPLKKLERGMGLYQVFNWPDKAPDKSKPWAVANLQTGDVNGRWHATKEEALAQARLLYATLGAKAKVQSEADVQNAFFCFADPALLVADSGVKWVEAIAPKTYTTPAYGDVVVTKDKIDNFIHNLNNNVRGQDVAINYEHGIDPAKGHKAAGWIRGARKNADGSLELAVEFTEPAKQELKNKEWRYFSLEWDDEWLHPDGMIFNDVIIGGGLTNRPVAKGLMPINFSEIFIEQADAEFEFAVWSSAYINNLPDSSFLFIQSGGKKDSSGKTEPRILRHLPYKDENGKIDLAHLRNAIARIPQMVGINQTTKDQLQARARKLLDATNMSELLEIDSEQKEWEHSEPGISNPPPPRQDEDGSDDPDRQQGWRRDTPPIAEDVFKFTEQQAVGYLLAAIRALKSYISVEPDADDKKTAQGYIDTITNLMNKDKKEYSEYTDLCAKVKKFFEAHEHDDDDAGVSIKFSEAEAIGYLTSAKTGLDRLHTNSANLLIEKIDTILGTDFRKRSFNELQGLVTETRKMLRGDGVTNTTSRMSEGRQTVGELTEKDLRELRNVLDVDDDGRILEAVKIRFGELSALRDAVSASEQERVFAEQYPQFYQQHMHLLERDRRNTARSFSESVQQVRKAEGFGLKTTKQGLSTKALEKLQEAHMKFSEGKGTLEDFEECVRTIIHGGIVQFGEIGSSADDSIPEIDATSAPGIAGARRLFAEVVSKIQKDNPDMPYLEAVSEASRKHPDLAETYKITLPA